MTLQAERAPRRPTRSRGVVIGTVVALAVVAAMAYDTRIVTIGGEHDVQAEVFSPATFGAKAFPEIRSSVETRAVDAAQLATELGADKAAATTKYGISGGTGPVFPVKFTGTVGEGKSGLYKIAVAGVPPETTVRVQTGPAINGTDLRDATGTIGFGQFKNQIEYQNAAAAINDKMKKDVLAGIDNSALTGKTVTVTGVFRLVNPKNWLVTPVAMSVQ
jgi:predicted lipoprotein